MSTDRRVPLSSRLAYGVGQYAEGLKNTAFGLFILFYYNQVLELSGTLAGLALSIALLVDAVTDPLVGSLSDNFRSKWGRRHPFMYVSALPLAIAFVLLFSPPDSLGQTGLFVWLTAFAVLTRVAMTLYHVPHLALGAEMSEDFEERTRIVAFRQFFATFGGACASVIGLGFFFADANGGRTAVGNYPPYAITLGVLMVFTIWYSAYGTQKEIPHLSIPASRTAASLFSRLLSEIREAFRSHSFRWLFAGVLVISVMGGVTAALDLYMLQYFWEFGGYDMLGVQVSMIAGLMIGAFFTSLLHSMTSKRFTILLGAIGYSICQFTPVILRLVDWFPENGDPVLVFLLIAIKFVQGVLLQQALVSWGSMIADVTDEHEFNTGIRQEGLFFGASSFSAKATSGLGSFIGGIGLDAIDWPRGAEIKSAADVPVDTIINLGLLYGPFIAGFAVVAIWCYSHYDLTREKHIEILRALQTRRQRDAQ